MNRKIGIFYAYWADSWEADFLPYVAKVKNLGFDQLEIQAAATLKMGDEKRRKLKQEADACGIELSYGIGLTADMDVSSLDEATRQRGVAFMKDIIRAVSSINGKMISGTVHSYWPASPPERFTDKQPVREQSLRLRRNVK